MSNICYNIPMKNKFLHLLPRLCAVGATIPALIFLYYLSSIAFLPTKFYLPLCLLVVALAALTLYLAFSRHRQQKSHIAAIALALLITASGIFASIKLSETKHFIDTNFASESTQTTDVTTEPFLIYLQGIDTRSGTMPDKSLADVNIIAAVDPAEHKLLLVAIPRDAYIHLHNTSNTALSDKLTHAGSLGGLDLSKATIEDLLGIEIPYYLRVNFNFVEGLVNAIGGITLYSDQSTPFTCWTNKNCTFQPGDNFVQGDCALAFARERKTYESGDRHRGENQEQVISRILAKTASSNTLLSNYSNILSALDGTFQTNFTSSDVTALIRQQLNTLSGWQVETFNIDGTGDNAVTYSYPSQPLYVLHLSPDSLQAAKDKLQHILDN